VHLHRARVAAGKGGYSLIQRAHDLGVDFLIDRLRK
jgi:hypothetical protein